MTTDPTAARRDGRRLQQAGDLAREDFARA